jgi:hypothetical protein
MTALKLHPTRLLLLALAAGPIACGADDGAAEGPGAEGGGTEGGGTEGGGNGVGSNGSCTEDSLFEPRPYGEDGDMVRRIHLDAGSGDILFSTWEELYRLPSGSRTPELVARRPDDSKPLDGAFWVADGSLLLPTAAGLGNILTAAVPGATMDVVPVLYTVPESGGDPNLQVSTLEPSEDQVFYEINGVRVVGDEVVWIDARVEREDFSTASPLHRTYRAHRTSWRSPAADPVELYTSERDLDVPVIANGIAFIEEENSDRAEDGSLQRMIHLDDGSVDPATADDRYGGKVVAADDRSLIVSHELDLENIETFGVFRVSFDGSERERLLDLTPIFELRSTAGVWPIIDYDVESGDSPVNTYEPGVGLRRLGCVPAGLGTIHDALATEDAVYVSVLYRDLTSTILRYPR